MAYRIEMGEIKFEESTDVLQTNGVCEIKARLFPFQLHDHGNEIDFYWLGTSPVGKKQYEESIIKQYNLIKNGRTN